MNFIIRAFVFLSALGILTAPSNANDVRFVKSVANGCKTLGIVKAGIERPPTFMNDNVLLGAAMLDELKTKARALGADRLVIRDVANRRQLSTHGVAWWLGGTYVAEAFKC